MGRQVVELKKLIGCSAQRVTVNGSYSICMPALFNIFMNELEEVMGCTPVKFADGTNLGGTLNTLEDRGCYPEEPRQA